MLVSLLYLALQNRQLEKNQRAMMNQGVINRVADNTRWFAEPHMNELMTRVLARETQFTATELNRLQFILRSMLISFQDTYVQHKAGLADQITLENGLNLIRTVLAQPVYRAIWKSSRTTYAAEWIAYVDKLIEETPLAKPVDTVARFKANLAEVMR